MEGLNTLISIKYMVAGYAVIFTVITAYLISLVRRWRSLKRDLHMLDEMEKKQ